MKPIKTHSAAVAGSDDNERLRALLDNLEGTSDQDFPGVSLQPKPMEDLDKLIPRVDRVDDKTSDRVRAKESRTRSSRGFARFLVAICIGIAGALAWQSYGQAAKQMLAAKAPELGWSPETKQMIANLVEQLGWTKPPAPSESSAVHSVPEAQVATVAQTMPAAVKPQEPAARPIDPEQLRQIVVDLTALRQTVEQIAAAQDQMARKVDRLQAADQEIRVKISEFPPPPPIAAAPAIAGQSAPAGSAPSQDTQNTAVRASCGPDVQRLCPGISWENAGVIKCLNSHRMELSPTCDTYFKQTPGHRAAQKGAPKATSSISITPLPSRAPMPSPHP